MYGLRHHQILNGSLNNIQIKTLAAAPNVSKMCKLALTFARAHQDTLFANSELKREFMLLCVYVALYEAQGFKEIAADHSLEWLKSYPELTLSHTRSNYTPSTKSAHQNDIDYAALGFFGHIMLWANHLQLLKKCPTIIETYKLDISKEDIVGHLGGMHLWDRLRKDDLVIRRTRWKHIVKFRNMFPCEGDHFLLTLRFMNTNLDVPE